MAKEPEKKKSATGRVVGGAIQGGLTARWKNRKASPVAKKEATKRGAVDGGVGAIKNPVLRRAVKKIVDKNDPKR